MYLLLNGYNFPIYLKKIANCYGFIHPLDCNFEEKLEYYKNRRDIIPPKNSLLFKIDKNTKIYLTYFDYDIGKILIQADDLKVACSIGEAIVSFFTIFLNKQCFTEKKFIKLNKKPKLNFKKEDLIKEINKKNIDNIFYLDDITNGVYIDYDEIKNFPFEKIVEGEKIKKNLVKAMSYLKESFLLVNGNINRSFYECHYKKERPFLDDEERIIACYENMAKIELAHLSAFKGIEAFFDKSTIPTKPQQINDIKNMLLNNKISISLEYQMLYKVFVKKDTKSIEKYYEILRLFSAERDTKSGHGSARGNVIGGSLCYEDVYEIQNFLKELLAVSLA